MSDTASMGCTIDLPDGRDEMEVLIEATGRYEPGDRGTYYDPPSGPVVEWDDFTVTVEVTGERFEGVGAWNICARTPIHEALASIVIENHKECAGCRLN